MARPPRCILRGERAGEKQQQQNWSGASTPRSKHFTIEQRRRTTINDRYAS
ncbi:hypothetical protein ZEAMMB73_Zm00001d029646 [Zea mays]|uniref:Uncharacterized protein n=1 Tax=Zea mays TaxID=4577 RepID=A0A1D6K6G3_MAIZE|nr:hypothetical protein ZEAMMB73_Zm00001d048701 [Zea mays]ONL99217.1 hypothetical protein ZEAMMB73_Zm00001d029646 [Zea mays]